jgi:hypothetical protein
LTLKPNSHQTQEHRASDVLVGAMSNLWYHPTTLDLCD